MTLRFDPNVFKPPPDGVGLASAFFGPVAETSGQFFIVAVSLCRLSHGWRTWDSGFFVRAVTPGLFKVGDLKRRKRGGGLVRGPSGGGSFPNAMFGFKPCPPLGQPGSPRGQLVGVAPLGVSSSLGCQPEPPRLKKKKGFHKAKAPLRIISIPFNFKVFKKVMQRTLPSISNCLRLECHEYWDSVCVCVWLTDSSGYGL